MIRWYRYGSYLSCLSVGHVSCMHRPTSPSFHSRGHSRAREYSLARHSTGGAHTDTLDCKALREVPLSHSAVSLPPRALPPLASDTHTPLADMTYLGCKTRPAWPISHSSAQALKRTQDLRVELEDLLL